MPDPTEKRDLGAARDEETDVTGSMAASSTPQPTVQVAAYVVSRIPDDLADHSVWSIRVEATGHGRWAVRVIGRCLNKSGEWEHEPIPSSRTDEWLDTVRWDNPDEAIAAALAVEPTLTFNGMTPADVMARHR